eukprot:CAMPEP_0114299980 /NCGR_PEP_ID=MMETSP0059-20121206/13289_1 /TAXON_ID=36894 /ORGANISM="Pyramimonas parkeae, Strain CCMP726" /LENGTH=551 /DNA_ID=CAMNT_0001422541 /DNA_START=477 /DNA_END=2132 /DNA_ORIENTATION=+
MPSAQLEHGGIRGSISFVVKLLSSLGISGLTPEMLRQAKFNNPDPVGMLWRALHEAIILILAKFPKGPSPGEHLQKLWSRLTDEEGHLPGGITNVEFVQYYLGIWGYPHPSIFQLVPGSTQSRSLLLAFAWLLSNNQVLQKALDQHIDSLMPRKSNAPLPPYPEDTYSSDVAVAAMDKAKTLAAAYVQEASQLLAECHPAERARLLAQQTITMQGRTHAAANKLSALQRYRERLMHTLITIQLDQASRSSPPPMGQAKSASPPPHGGDDPLRTAPASEPELARSPPRSAERGGSGAAGAEAQINLFFEWMGSVLETDINERAAAGGSFTSPPPPALMRHQLYDLSMPELSELMSRLDKDVSQLILQHKQDMETLSRRWSQVDVGSLPPHEKQALEDHLQATLRASNVPSLEQLQADAVQVIECGQESQEAVLGEQETELPEDLKLQIDAALREDLVLADKQPVISRQYIGKRRISSPGAFSSATSSSKCVLAAQEIHSLRRAEASVDEMLETSRTRCTQVIADALAPLDRSSYEYVVYGSIGNISGTSMHD